jgi:ATP-dependent Clp protease ATP-binding subunit ClpA
MREVTIETVRDIVASWTGVPVEQLGAGDLGAEQLARLDEALRGEIVGQDAALNALCRAVQRRTAMGGEDRPIGSFLFVGPSGVGKTETAKALARHLFGSENHLTRFDMSEYSEPHSKARLIGAPPGYIGHEEGGQLTEAVKRRRFSVLLFDEIEKADKQVLTVLLQLMDDGRLTDSSGTTVDFRHTVVILTSNLGNTYVGGSRPNEEEAQGRVLDAVRQFLAPEFFGRLDEVVVFRRLNVADLQEVLRRELGKLAARLGKGLEITPSDLALRILAEQSVDGDRGARAVRATVQRQIEPGLMELRSRGLLDASDHAPRRVTIDLDAQGRFTFDVGSPP